MLDDIEHANHIKRYIEGRTVHIGLDESTVRPLAGITKAFGEQIHSDDSGGSSLSFQNPKDIAGPTADFKYAVVRPKKLGCAIQGCRNDRVSCPEPEMVIFRRKECVVNRLIAWVARLSQR